MYASVNFRTKKALKTAVKEGQQIRVHQVGPFGGNEPTEGRVCLEGPWYPEPHRWYASASLKDGVIVKVS